MSNTERTRVKGEKVSCRETSRNLLSKVTKAPAQSCGVMVKEGAVRTFGAGEEAWSGMEEGALQT